MYNKLVGIVVVTLLIVTLVLPVSGRIMFFNNEKITLDLKYNSLTSDNTMLKWMIAGDGLRCLHSYWLHVPPSYDGVEPVPLVIVLHGTVGFNLKRPLTSLFYFYKSSWMEDWTDFSKKADNEGFIVVYPNGKIHLPLKTFCYDVGYYNNSYWIQKLLGIKIVDSKGFIHELITDMQDKYTINSSRIYITGFSNGGDFSYDLGSVFSEKVAAISPIAGTIGGMGGGDEEYEYIPDPKHPVSVIVFHGTNDLFVPYEGSKFFVSVNESVAFWVEHNNCDLVPEINISESGNILTRTYTGGDSGTEVVLYTIVGGTHCWPGNDYPPDNPLHDPVNEISATDSIWEFFEAHPKQ